jgi:hypothetical protein
MRYFIHRGCYIPMFTGPGWPRTKKRRAFKKHLVNRKKVTFPEYGKMAWYGIFSFGPVYAPDEQKFVTL